MSHQSESESVRMEINGHPYYIKSKGSVPYLYDVDTNDEVGYWSSKKGQYIMFSLYNKIMKKKYEDIGDSIDSSESIKTQKGSESGSEKERAGSESSDSGSESSDSGSESSDSGSESSDSGSKSEITSEKTKNKMNYSFVFVFIVFFVYLTLQKEFQSIYFDFIFLILINLLHTFKFLEMLRTIDE